MSELASIEPLAYLQRRLRRVCETQPTVAIYNFVGAAEMITRFLVAAAAGELARGATDGRAALGERPTLERWLRAARELTKRVDEDRSTPAVPCLIEAARLLHELSVGDVWDPPEMAGPSGVVKLRNWLAHVGVPGEALARKLVPPLGAAFETVFAELARLFDGVEVRCGADRDGEVSHVYLAGPDGVVDLWPIFRYEVPGYGIERREDAQPVMQVFVRVERELPQYEVLDDNSIFAVGTGLEAAAYRERFGESTRGFWRDARALAEKRVGRRSELEQIAAELGAARVALSDTHPAAIRWLLAPIGVGKSLVAGCAAVQERERGADEQVLLHIFRAGDSRCSVTSFVDRALEELGADVFERDPKRRRVRLMAVLRKRRPTIICDGLDELEGEVRGAVRQLLDVAGKGGVWLMSSRPHPAFEETGFPAKNDIFGRRFPRMDDADLRSMVLETAPVPVRDAVLEEVRGPDQHYVDQLVKTADGSPQYLSLAIEWLASRGTPDAIKAQVRAGTVPGVSALYDELFDRWGASDIGSVKDLVLCTLAQASEPLGAEALAEVVYHGFPLRDEAQRERRIALCSAALRAFFWTLELAPDSDGRTGMRVVHESARKHLACSDRHAEDWSNTKALLSKVCRDPASLLSDQLRRHAYRYGVSYAFANGDERDVGRMIARYGYLWRRLRELGHRGVDGLVADLQRAAEAASGRGATAGRLAEWRRLLAGKAHLLRRGTEDWGAERIFQQLAWEDGPERLAEAPPLHRAWPAKPIPETQALVGTLPLERDVTTILAAAPSRILLVSPEGPIEMFTPSHDVVPQRVLNIPGYRRGQPQVTREGNVLLFDSDRVYALDASGELIAEWCPPAGDVHAGACLQGSRLAVAADGRLHVLRLCRDGLHVIASPETPAAERLVSIIDGQAVVVWNQAGHGGIYSVADEESRALPTQPGLLDIVALDPDLIVLLNVDQELVACDATTGQEVARSGRRTAGLRPATVRTLSGTLVWPEDDDLWHWDPRSPERPKRLRPMHHPRSRGRMLVTIWLTVGLSTGLAATVGSGERAIRLWSPNQGQETGVLEGHWGAVKGLLEVGNGHIASWSEDGTIRTWDPVRREPVAAFGGHNQAVLQVVDGRDGTLVSLGQDRTLRWWDLDKATSKSVRPELDGVIPLSRDVLLGWSRSDSRIRRFHSGSGHELAHLRGHRGGVRGVVPLARDTVASWADDGQLRVWRAGRRAGVVRRDTGRVEGALSVADEHMLIWTSDELSLAPVLNRSDATVLCRFDGAAWFRVDAEWPWVTAWSSDGPLRAWNLADAPGNTAPVVTPIDLKSRDGTLATLVRGACFVPGSRLVTWSGQGALRVWDLCAGRELSTIGGPRQPWLEEPGIAGLPNDRLVIWARGGLTAFWDFSLHVYDIASGRKLRDLHGHRGWIEDARAFGTSRLLSWSGDGTIRLWDVETGDQESELNGHFGPVVDVATARGLVTSWSAEGTIRVWDAELRSLVAAATYDESPGPAPAWCPGTETLVWTTSTAEPLALSGEALGSDLKIRRQAAPQA